jgi:hypothetical protein
MISLLLRIALLFVPAAVLASEIGQQDHWNSVQPSDFVLASNSQCADRCDREYTVGPANLPPARIDARSAG